MDYPKNLPVVFEGKKEWGLKTSSFCQYVLDGKLSEANKQELLAFAKKENGLSASHKQNDHLYELRSRGYVLVVDSSGPNDRVHIRTVGGKINLYLSILGPLFTTILLIGLISRPELSFKNILIIFATIFLSFLVGMASPLSPKKTIEYQEKEIVKMVQKINEVLSTENLNTDH